jgi:Bacteroidetes VLRF1 release factor/Ankyrin repeats (many copies)
LTVKGSKPVDEATFIKLVDDLAESISGSESSGSESEEDVMHARDTTLNALLRRQAKISQQEDDTQKSKSAVGKSPLLWLSSSKLGADVALGIYRALLSDHEQEEAQLHLVDIVKRKQLQPIHAKHSGSTNAGAGDMPAGPHLFLCMIGGGHFAAMIVSLIPEIRKGQGGVEERHAVVKAHKTFHRYTTRRKQGGSQSANDNAKGNAHSAGSSIRRYNEAALEVDIRSVLAEWKDMIESSELWFIRATGTTNRRTLFGPYDGQILRTNDKRLRGFPFSTRRATQAELLRSFQELTRLKVSTITESAVEKSAVEQPVVHKQAKPAMAPPKLTKEEEEAILHTSQLQALIRRSKAPGVLLYLSKNKLSPNYTFYPPNDHHHSPTLLHLAASTNSQALVTALLLKAGADPTITNGDGRTAYDIAGDAKTRDVFRVARHQLGEKSFDWSAAHVPSPLTQEEVDARSQREKAAADKAEVERRKAELELIRKTEEHRNVGRIEKKAGMGKSLGAEKSGAERREEEGRGLTPEMRMRLERERRARAAEERIKKMQGGG